MYPRQFMACEYSYFSSLLAAYEVSSHDKQRGEMSVVRRLVNWRIVYNLIMIMIMIMIIYFYYFIVLFFTFFSFLFLDQRLGYRISLNLYVRRHLQLIINSSASLPYCL